MIMNLISMRNINQKYIAFLSIFLFLALVKSVFALNINVHVPEKYTDVEAGERLYFEVEIKYPENPKRKDLRLEYEIKEDGKIIANAKFLKAVETQASFMDYIVIPESAEKGLHIINVAISDYENLKEEVSASFQITGSKKDQLKNYFLILLGVILIVVLLVVIEIVLVKKWSRVVSKM